MNVKHDPCVSKLQENVISPKENNARSIVIVKDTGNNKRIRVLYIQPLLNLHNNDVVNANYSTFVVHEEI